MLRQSLFYTVILLSSIFLWLTDFHWLLISIMVFPRSIITYQGCDRHCEERSNLTRFILVIIERLLRCTRNDVSPICSH